MTSINIKSNWVAASFTNDNGNESFSDREKNPDWVETV